MSDSVVSAPRAPASAFALRAMSDDRLVRLVSHGSETAFTVLYHRHHQALYRYCATIVRHEHDAQDVLQTTMVRALGALRHGVPDAPLRPWLFRIAHNEAISVLRRRRPTEDIDDARDVAGPALERRVEDRSRLSALVADLQDLPDRQRGALVMRELSGLSHEEIAMTLDISVAGAKQAIFDARTGLQEFAKGREMHCAEIERLISDGDGRMLRGRPVRAHLRGCPSCSALRDAIGARRSDLAVLAPPLPVLAATGLLAKILGAGGGHGGAGGGGLMAIGAAGKATSAIVAGKAIATAAIVVTVGVGATQAVPALTARPPQHAGAAPARAEDARAAAAAPQASTRLVKRTRASARASVRPRPAAGSGPDAGPTPVAATAATQPASAAAIHPTVPDRSRSAAAPGAARSTAATQRSAAARAAASGASGSRPAGKAAPRRSPAATAHATGPSAAVSPSPRVVPVVPATPAAHPASSAPPGGGPPAGTPAPPVPPSRPLVPGAVAP